MSKKIKKFVKDTMVRQAEIKNVIQNMFNKEEVPAKIMAFQRDEAVVDALYLALQYVDAAAENFPKHSARYTALLASATMLYSTVLDVTEVK